VTTPGGLVSATTASRTATFFDPAGDPKDPANVASLTDTVTVNGKTATAVQDLVNRRVTTTSPEGRQSTTAFDVFGRPTEIALPGVAPVQYGYEARGRLQTLTQGTRTTTYTYDPATGFVSKITDPAAREVSFTYDLAGRVKTQTLPDSRVVRFSYPSGNVTSITPPGRPAHAFGHTPIDLPETYTPPDVGLAEHATTLAYNADRQVELVTRPDGQTIDSVYDPASGRLTSVVTPRGTYGYAYDPASGNLATATEPDGGTLAYGYDGALPTSVTWTGEVAGSVGFAYDDDFELVSRTVNGTDSVAFDHDQDGLLTVAGALTLTHDPAIGFLAGTTLGTLTDSYTYDPNFGELASKSAGTQTVAYDYGVLGNLRQVVLADGLTIDYVVDAANRRVGKNVGGVLAQAFLYQDGLNPVAELDGTGAVVSTFVYASKPNVPDYLVKAGTTYRLIADPLGSIRLVVNATDGTVAQRLDYDAFGRVMLDTNPGFQPFGFAGGLYDPQTGLLRFGARDYDPETGRWTSKDPIGFAGGGSNLYGYVLADPINAADPSGLFLDTILDIGFVSYDLFKLVSNLLSDCPDATLGEDLLALGADTLGAALPFVTGLGEATRLARYTDEAIEAARARRRVGKLLGLPLLDATGKVHGKLPDVKDLGRYTIGELTQLRNELQLSVQRRIELTVQKGSDLGHGQRQAAEQQLIKSIEKHLENR
jgi:RHS repeat-associated protein